MCIELEELVVVERLVRQKKTNKKKNKNKQNQDKLCVFSKICFFTMNLLILSGVATTFVNKTNEESILLDLKHLLIEAKQKLPVCLAILEDPSDFVKSAGDVVGCAYCGGLGHRLKDCPKLQSVASKSGPSKDFSVGADY
jgi:hypothetical protein